MSKQKIITASIIQQSGVATTGYEHSICVSTNGGQLAIEERFFEVRRVDDEPEFLVRSAIVDKTPGYETLASVSKLVERIVCAQNGHASLDGMLELVDLLQPYAPSERFHLRLELHTLGPVEWMLFWVPDGADDWTSNVLKLRGRRDIHDGTIANPSEPLAPRAHFQPTLHRLQPRCYYADYNFPLVVAAVSEPRHPHPGFSTEVCLVQDGNNFKLQGRSSLLLFDDRPCDLRVVQAIASNPLPSEEVNVVTRIVCRIARCWVPGALQEAVCDLESALRPYSPFGFTPLRLEFSSYSLSTIEWRLRWMPVHENLAPTRVDVTIGASRRYEIACGLLEYRDLGKSADDALATIESAFDKVKAAQKEDEQCSRA